MGLGQERGHVKLGKGPGRPFEMSALQWLLEWLAEARFPNPQWRARLAEVLAGGQGRASGLETVG